MFARIDAVDADTVRAVADRFIYDQDVAIAAVGDTQFLPGGGVVWLVVPLGLLCARAGGWVSLRIGRASHSNACCLLLLPVAAAAVTQTTTGLGGARTGSGTDEQTHAVLGD
jgi:hypothetical protein